MENSEIKIATNIETGIFYSVIELLKTDNWNLSADYDEKMFDKGIDFDFYEFCKGNEKISLAWSNWFEGEIEARTERLNEIAQHFKIELKYNQPEYLHRPGLVESMKNLNLLMYHCFQK
jgi:hypothetical protein